MRAGRMAQPTPEMRSAQLEMHRLCGLLLQSRGQLQRGLAAICAAAKEEGYVSPTRTNSLRYSQQHLPVPLSPDCCWLRCISRWSSGPRRTRRAA